MCRPMYSRRRSEPGTGVRSSGGIEQDTSLVCSGSVCVIFSFRGAVTRTSAPLASSAARASARSERPPSRLACIRQAIRLMSHDLWRLLVDSPKTSINLLRSWPMDIDSIAKTSMSTSNLRDAAAAASLESELAMTSPFFGRVLW